MKTDEESEILILTMPTAHPDPALAPPCRAAPGHPPTVIITTSMPQPQSSQHDDTLHPSLPITIADLGSVRHEPTARALLDRIARIEKRSFPSSEAMDFSSSPEQWHRKPNTVVLYAQLQQTSGGSRDMGGGGGVDCDRGQRGGAKGGWRRGQGGGHRVAGAGKTVRQETTTTTTTTTDPNVLIGYAVYVRVRATALLHKICVSEPHRTRGVGRALLAAVLARLRREGCGNVVLWVDVGRTTARRLYEACGFEAVEEVSEYYGPGRSGVRMVLAFDV